jgi:AraC-like DNA-binding protein
VHRWNATSAERNDLALASFDSRGSWLETRAVSSPSTPNTLAHGAVVRAPLGVLVALRDAGIDVERVAAIAGIDRSRVSGPSPRLDGKEMAALLDAVFDRRADAALGLRIGAVLRPELFGIVGLAALSAPTYGDAIACCARYKRLLGQLSIEIERRGKRAVVRVEERGREGERSRGRIEIELAFFASLGRRHASKAIFPLEIRLRAGGTSSAECEALVGCPVRFGQTADELWLAATSLDVPLLGADAEAHPFLVSTADRKLELLDRGGLRTRVTIAIETNLPESTPSLRKVARALRMSERSLQRRLREEGTTFNEVLDDTRRSIALQHLKSGHFEPVEVAFLAGFTHLSSFYRAFRRWTGTTPEVFRENRSAS